MTLVISVKVGETIHVGTARIRLAKKSGQCARFHIDVDGSVPVSLEKEVVSGKGTVQPASYEAP